MDRKVLFVSDYASSRCSTV